ncbi:MAG: MBL fold metallo-hydrolase [Atopobiaceae bacterium]|jgi:phosphoribosyl 1,2-cyclic phosphodiesterase
MIPKIHLSILASGSKGNAALVQGPAGLVLIDCGISRKALRDRMCQMGYEPQELTAIILTHEHTDHISGLRVFSKDVSVPIYATAGTAAHLTQLALPLRLISHDETLFMAGMRITCFPTSHDVGDPIGLRFDVTEHSVSADAPTEAAPAPAESAPAGEKIFSPGANADEVLDALGWMTDTGYVTEQAFSALRGCRILGIEANHDPQMLAHSPYPAAVRKRIAGDRGHLSNDQCAEALDALVTHETETVVALHLSEKNNRPSLALAALAKPLDAVCDGSGEARSKDGLLSVCVASQTSPMSVY